MKILSVKVVPNSKKNKVTVFEKHLKVHTISPPLDYKANDSVIELLAKHFKIRKSKIKILKGLKSKDKIVRIDL